MKLSLINKIQPDKRSYSPSSELRLNRRDIGIEIEAENYKGGGNAPKLWKLVQDGSLRNGGIELVSDVLRGTDIIKGISTANAFCARHELVFSDRCSVHIHLDVRALSTEELILLLGLYCIFEKFFFSICGDPSRQDNNHCRPIQSSTGLYELIRSLHSTSNRSVHQAINHWSKYTAFNIRPILAQGSVEFRHHVGTANKKELLSWINTIFCLADYVRKNKGASLQDEIDKVCLDGRELFNNVFPIHSTLFNEGVHEDMLEGARYIQLPINTLQAQREERVEDTDELLRPMRGTRRDGLVQVAAHALTDNIDIEAIREQIREQREFLDAVGGAQE